MQLTPRLLPLLLLLAATPTRAATEADQIKSLGSSKSQPIANPSFLFLGGFYLDAPYTVERRGLNIYINGLFLESLHPAGWPIRDNTLKDDPGPPPPNTTPFDRAPKDTPFEDLYWTKKWRYLATNNEYNDAIAKLTDAYRNDPSVKSVTKKTEWSPGKLFNEGDPKFPALGLDIELKDGKKGPIVVTYSMWQAVRGIDQITKPDILKQLETARTNWEKKLAQPGALFLFAGDPWNPDLKQTSQILEILLSADPYDAQIKQLRQLFPDKMLLLEQVATDFRPTALLRERFADLKKSLGENPPEKTSAPHFPTEAQAIKDFGASKSDPIPHDGFLFLNGLYIDPPFIIERRGFNIYLNGLYLETAYLEEWPTPDWKLNEDPGPAPDGVTPFDRAPKGARQMDTHWNKKWRYLATKYEYNDAIKKMAEALQADPQIKSATPKNLDGPDGQFFRSGDREHPNLVLDLQLKNGPHGPIMFTYPSWQKIRGINPPTKESVLESIEARRAHWEKGFSPQMGDFFYKGAGYGFSLPNTLQTISILSTGEDFESQLNQLHKLHPHASAWLDRLAINFRPTPLLLERAAASRKTLTERELENTRIPPIPDIIKAATQPHAPH